MNPMEKQLSVSAWKANSHKFEMSDGVLEVDESPNGWGELVQGGLEVREIPGDHNMILSKRGTLILGDTLGGCLLDAQARADET